MIFFYILCHFQYKRNDLKLKLFFFGYRRDTGNAESDYPRRCAREIKTYSRGWPQHARFCDEEDLHDAPDFCRLHDLLLEKLGGIMEESNELNFVSSTNEKK